jgi:hypothetical protein
VRRPTQWTTCTPLRSHWSADESGVLQILPLALGSAEIGFDEWTRTFDRLGVENPPQEPQLAPVDANLQAVNFSGAWGLRDHLRALPVPFRGDLIRQESGPGPASPACKGLWRDPLYAIFCQPKLWSAPRGCPKRQKPLYSPSPCSAGP